jgi:hypothetical protein
MAKLILLLCKTARLFDPALLVRPIEFHALSRSGSLIWLLVNGWRRFLRFSLGSTVWQGLFRPQLSRIRPREPCAASPGAIVRKTNTEAGYGSVGIMKIILLVVIADIALVVASTARGQPFYAGNLSCSLSTVTLIAPPGCFSGAANGVPKVSSFRVARSAANLIRLCGPA